MPDRKKIAVFADQNNFNFMGNIIPYLSGIHEVKIFNAFEQNDLKIAAEWADIIYVEWVEKLVSIFSNSEIRQRLICRLHSYEAYSPYLEKINWKKIDSLIFISSQIRKYVEEKHPLIKEVQNIYTISEGVDLNKFYFTNRTHGNNLAFVAQLIQTKNISLLLQAFKLLKNKNPELKLHLFGKYVNDSGISPGIPKRYMEHQIEMLGIKEDVIFYGELPQKELIEKMKQINYIISTSYREGLPFNILEAMAMGIMPLIHNWPGAGNLFPDEYLFNFIGELPKKLNVDYDSAKYRKFVELNHNLKKSLPLMEKIILGEEIKEDTKKLEIETSRYNSLQNFKRDKKNIRLLYLAFASPAYPQILLKINQQLKIFKELCCEAEGLVIGFGEIEESKYLFKYFNLYKFPYSNYNVTAFSGIENFADEYQPDLIYFRYPGASKYLENFVKNYPNVIFENQTKELEEYAKLDDPSYYENEIKYGKAVLDNTAAIVAITDEIAEHEKERGEKEIFCHVSGNGILEQTVPLVEDRFPTNLVNVLFAGHFSEWHGFDRIIKGMCSFTGKANIHFHVVGDGEKKEEYVQLVKKHKLEKVFSFYGSLPISKIDEIADKCHIAIGSLGLHRINLRQAAPIKHREYCLRGLPFITSVEDVDFKSDLPFILKVPADESPINIETLIDFAMYRLKSPLIKEDVRNYALKNLLWESKISDTVGFFEKVNSKLHADISLFTDYRKHIEKNSIVSIVIPCYNQADFLEEAIESVISQTYKNWEIIIVNDGSTDRTSEIANQLIKQYPHFRIKLIEQENCGLSSARNRGIRAASGKFFIPLDADDKLEKTFIEKALSIIRKNPGMGFVYSHIKHFGEREDIYYLPEFDAAKLLTNNIVCVCSLINIKTWEQTGGYNEDMKEGYEDWDFWIHAAKLGWKGYRIDEPLFFYRKRKNSMLSDSNKKAEKLFATIVSNHPELYPEEVQDNSLKILQKDKNDINYPDKLKSKIVVTYLINNILGVTGGNQTLLKQANELVLRGYDVYVVTYSRKPGWFDLKAQYVKVPDNVPMAGYVPASDIVISTYFMNTHELNKIQAPVKIYFVQGDQYLFNDKKPELKKEYEKIYLSLKTLSQASYKYPDVKIIANSKNLARHISKKYGVNAADILPVGIDNTIFQPIKKKGQKNNLNILIVGPDIDGHPLEPLDFKGISDIRKAFNLVDKNKFNIIRISNTDRDIFDGLKCEYYKTPNNSQKKKKYGEADILIYASHYDSCPLPPLEAMSSGAAVICTETEGAKEYCVNGYNSILIPIKSPEKIAEALNKLSDDRELREKIINGGFETASHFTFDLMMKNLEIFFIKNLMEKDPIKMKNNIFEKINFLITSKNYRSVLDFLEMVFSADNRLQEITKEDSISLFNIGGNIALIINEVDKARLYFEKALNNNPQSSEACAGLAEIFLLEENFEAAKIMFGYAYSYNPKNKNAENGLKKADTLIKNSGTNNSMQEIKLPDQNDLQINNRNDFGSLFNSLDLLEHGAEVGVQAGEFSKIIRSSWKGKYLHLIDRWRSDDNYKDIANIPDEKQKQLYYYVMDTFADDPGVFIYKMDSVFAARQFPDNYFDWVYIDADHSYNGCKNDLNAWYSKVKPGGIFAGHDFLDGIVSAGEFGVKSAVLEFVSDKDTQLFITEKDLWKSWYFIKPSKEKNFSIAEKDGEIKKESKAKNFILTENQDKEEFNSDGLVMEAYELFNSKKFEESLNKLIEAEKFFNGHLSNPAYAGLAAAFYNLKGFNYIGLNEMENARECFERALNLDPNSSEACAGLGEYFHINGIEENAKVMFEYAVKNNPENRFAADELSKVNSILNLPDDLNPVNETSEKLMEKLNQILNSIFELFNFKKYQEALEALTNTEELFYSQYGKQTENEIISAYENLKGMVMLALNRNDDAQQAFESALNINPGSSQACAGLGEVSFISGKDQEAKAMYEWGVKHNPQNQFAVEGLRKVNRILGLNENDNTLLADKY
jgi:glycosyltransferase involved in cell wall biosynthesis/Tfp pilus assembly protein PilF